MSEITFRRGELFGGVGLMLLGGGILAFALTGCASAPPKQAATVSTQRLHVALAAAQDIEMRLCAPAPAALNRCLAVPAVLTDVQHQAIEGALGKAFDAERVLATALLAWQPGAAMPSSVADMQREVTAAVAAVRAVVPTGRATQILDQILAVQAILIDLRQTLGGSK